MLGPCTIRIYSYMVGSAWLHVSAISIRFQGTFIVAQLRVKQTQVSGIPLVFQNNFEHLLIQFVFVISSSICPTIPSTNTNWCLFETDKVLIGTTVTSNIQSHPLSADS
jgi:hypothetical protein